MQDAANVDLANALDSPLVVMHPVIEIDWDRNGLYNNTYSDLTRVCGTVEIEAAEIKGDIPDEINTVAGASSGVMTVVFHGQRSSDELRVSQLLARYWVASPLYGYRKEGTPIRMSVRTQTAAGWDTKVQFTGWIISYASDEDHDEVTLRCSDVYDMQNALVTLPLWAIGPRPEQGSVYNPADGSVAPDWHAIDTGWVYDEILRQSGRAIGPVPRADCVAYWTCNGSFLPSVGTLAERNNSQHRISWENAGNDWTTGPYGLVPRPITWGSGGYLSESKSACRTSVAVTVPNNGGAPDNIPVAIATWAVSNGNAAHTVTGDPSVVFMQLDTGYAGYFAISPGYFTLLVWDNGMVEVLIHDAPTASGAVTRTWNFHTARSAGAHYICATAAFTHTGVSLELRIDDVVVSTTSSSVGSGGYRYANGLLSHERGNPTYMAVQSAPLYHAQIYKGVSAATYATAQKLPVNNPAKAVLGRTSTELVWIPDVKERKAWDVLREAISAELGVLHTDEFGVLRFVRRDTVWYGSGPGSVTTRIIPRGKVRGIAVQPSADTYRNTVSISSTKRVQERAIVWQNGDPLQHFVGVGESKFAQYTMKDVVNIEVWLGVISTTPPATGPSITAAQVCAIQANNLAATAAFGWAAGVDWFHNQRMIGLGWAAGSSGQALFIGAFLNGNQAAFLIGGQRYSTPEIRRTVYSDAAEVTARGTALLELPDSVWRQSDLVSEALAESLLRDLIYSIPIISDLSIAPDPRLQLLDVVELPEAQTITGTQRFQIIGKRLKYEAGMFEQKLTLRALPR